jgi:Tol biopolymer transport system component
MKPTKLVLLTGLLCAALFAGSLANQAKDNKAEVALQAAIKTETVDGNLKGAIEQYQKIAAQPGAGRATVATALLRMGQCHEKLGNAEARTAYERLVRDFADQAEIVAQAKARLSALEPGAAGTREAKGIVVRKVREGSGYGCGGSPSPDGKYFSDMEWKSGNLLVRNLSTGEERVLTESSGDDLENAFYSVFSPDGRKLAYSWSKKDGKFGIRTIGLDGSGPRTLIDDLAVDDIGPLGWTSDGQNILAFIWRNISIYEIVQIAAKGGSFRVLKTLDGFNPRKARLSPDGRYIVYDRLPTKTSQNLDIFLLRVDGGQEIPLVEHEANDTVLGWTPDGKGVLFASNRTGSIDCWVVPVADGQPQGAPGLIRKDIGEVTPLGFTRNGSFYYGVQTAISDVFIAPLDVEAGKLLSLPAPLAKRFVGNNNSPAWSPDGKFLAYILDRTPKYKSILCLRSMETGKERDINPAMYFGWPIWSPDGRTILIYGMKTEGPQGFFFIDPQSGELAPFVLKEGERFVQQAAWSPDGKTIFFRRGSDDFKESWFVKRQVETGQETELLHNYPINESAVSPDGQRIVFRSYDEPDTMLKTMLVSGGDIQEIVRVKNPEWIPGYSGLAWTPDGRFVLYLTARQDPQGVEKTELWRVDVGTGERKSFGLAMDRMRNIALHPDGKRIAFDSGMPKIEIWVMENFLPALKVAK